MFILWHAERVSLPDIPACLTVDAFHDARPGFFGNGVLKGAVFDKGQLKALEHQTPVNGISPPHSTADT